MRDENEQLFTHRKLLLLRVAVQVCSDKRIVRWKLPAGAAVCSFTPRGYLLIRT
jgi:hypothetical protein